jgi:hypothetical protein
MAMCIGDQYSSEKVSPRDFEQLATDAGLAKPLVRARLLEVTDRVMAALPNIPTPNSVSEQVANLIRHRCETAANRFRTRA